MAFEYNEFGVEVQREPAKAAVRLEEVLRKANYSLTNAAKALGVNKSTLHRWCKSLEKRGYGDPRAANRPPPVPEADVPLVAARYGEDGEPEEPEPEG